MYDRQRALQILQSSLAIVFFTVGLGLLIFLAINYYHSAPPPPEAVSRATSPPRLEGSPSVREAASRPKGQEEKPSPLGPFLPPDMKEEVLREYLQERVQEAVAAELDRRRETAPAAEAALVSPPPPLIQSGGDGRVPALPEVWSVPPVQPVVTTSGKNAEANPRRPVRISLPRSLFATEEQAAEAANLLGTQLAEQGCWATIVVTTEGADQPPTRPAGPLPTPAREERKPEAPSGAEPTRLAQAPAVSTYPSPPPQLAPDVGRDSAGGLFAQTLKPSGPLAPPQPPERKAYTVGDVYLVQCGTLNTAAAARERQAQLQKEGLAVHMRDLSLAGPRRYILWLGPFSNRSEAEALRQALAVAGQEASLITTVRFVQEADASGAYAVQVGSFAKATYADRLRQALEQEKLPAFVEPVETSEGRLYRVLVGPVRSEQEARRAARGLEQRGYQTVVMTLAKP